jgi:hypothetical protein
LLFGSDRIRSSITIRVSTFRHIPAYPSTVPLPETIPVRYTEEEAGYVTVRPLVRQTFRLDELLDMILSVAGKDVTRIRQLLHSGTVVYHFYRYSWAGFDAKESELAAALARFPDDQPSRPFGANQCTNAVFDGAGANPRHLLDLDRAAASRRRLFRGESFWESLLETAAQKNPHYQKYSYSRRADLYRLDLDSEISLRIAEAANRLASGKLRSVLRILPEAEYILFVCPRPANRK